VWLCGLHGVQSEAGVGEGTPGAHLRSDPDRLHDLLGGVVCSQSQLGVALDAVWTLGHVRDGYCDELLGFLGQSAIGEDGLAEALERVMDTRRQLLAPLGLGGCGGWYTDSFIGVSLFEVGRLLITGQGQAVLDVRRLRRR